MRGAACGREAAAAAAAPANADAGADAYVDTDCGAPVVAGLVVAVGPAIMVVAGWRYVEEGEGEGEGEGDVVDDV